MKTRDKRRDSGQYYPGGRVIARPGTAPQQIVVQWSDVQGKPQIAPLPDRYRESDMKGKINEIASKFATVLMAALLGWTALGGVTVHTARKDQIYNDEPIVTNVTYSAEAETDPTVADWAKKPNPAPVTDLTPAIEYTTAVSNRFESKVAAKQDALPYETNAIPSEVIADAPWITQHQSLAPATNYTDAATNAAYTAATNYTDTATNRLYTEVKTEFEHAISGFTATNRIEKLYDVRNAVIALVEAFGKPHETNDTLEVMK